MVGLHVKQDWCLANELELVHHDPAKNMFYKIELLRIKRFISVTCNTFPQLYGQLWRYNPVFPAYLQKNSKLFQTQNSQNKYHIAIILMIQLLLLRLKIFRHKKGPIKMYENVYNIKE